MKTKTGFLKIAIIGGGPSGLFMFKRLVDSGVQNLAIDIYEQGDCLGCGMPYSRAGAADEHITNVSGNEIPQMATSVSDWIKTVPKDTLDKYHIDPDRFNEYKVLPRLLFGQYLSYQFNLLLKQAKAAGLETNIHYKSLVADLIDQPEQEMVNVLMPDGSEALYDRVIICTGHLWPKKHEGKVPGWFDSPYPPEKISLYANHPVAIRGASLTAIDAVRTLARHNGEFIKDKKGKLCFQVSADSPNFRIVMHSRNGLLPAVRFHLEDTHLGKDTVLDEKVIRRQMELNDGFLPLDYVFEYNFKDGIREHDPDYYQKIKDMRMEDFVAYTMNSREQRDPFELLKAEYAEAERSIKQKRSVYWKEMLAILSFAMNYPAKHFSAEDMLCLQETLMPLISVVIAFVPQSSAEMLMALHDAGRLSMVTVGEDSEVIPDENGGATYSYTEDGQQHKDHYPVFVDSIGQPHLVFNQLPFPGLREWHTISPARLRFHDQKYGQELLAQGDKNIVALNGVTYLTVPGLAINDHFQPLDSYNALNDRLYIMAVPFIGGYNPDYSGLDFCEAASKIILGSLLGTMLAPD
ncbi:FAD/NAD(P)-binding protein [Mucilaginibacter mali]|uniref:FAD/NAD(P)-binding protein n=1 Tax=Mucilaginibacter mali TaxID=2740462 RepID=A0A7D4Q9H0_9SPHI|nr:FAD/NAD(P)-binding protein [Mucilaginibacter mali]QKJ29344.1 FAD/NAD(P)-binding protein [Mucilaginibacter mali]